MRRYYGHRLAPALVALLAFFASALFPAVADAQTVPGSSGDGADLIELSPSGHLILYPGDGAGGLGTWSAGIGTQWGVFTDVLTPGDWDGDGNADLIAVTTAGSLILYSGDGHGGFTYPYPQIGNGWASFTDILTPGDWNGDGNADLIAVTTTGDLTLYPGDGAGGFSSPLQIGNGWASFTDILTPGDWDGDGNADLIAQTAAGTLFLYPGNGAGGFGSSQIIDHGWGPLTGTLLTPGNWDAQRTSLTHFDCFYELLENGQTRGRCTGPAHAARFF